MAWDTWGNWNTGYYYTRTTSSSSTDSTWSGWANRGTGTYYASGTNSSTWSTWNSTWVYEQPQPLSPMMRMRQERGAHRIKLEAHFRRIAKLRARRLLLTVLSPRQREEFRESDAFIVYGSDGGTYELQLGRYHNIFRLNEDGESVEELCGCVEEAVPDEDNLVAQKLWLETNESYFRSMCNIWDVTGFRRVQTQSSQREGRYGGQDAAYTRGEVLV